MASSLRADIEELNIAERLQLLEDIWDSIAATPAELPVTQAQRDELDRRLEAHHQDPRGGASWEEVKTRIAISR